MIVKSLFLVFSLFSGIITPDHNGVILVKTEGIHPQKGHIQINVYNTDKGFPTEEELALKRSVERRVGNVGCGAGHGGGGAAWVVRR